MVERDRRAVADDSGTLLTITHERITDGPRRQDHDRSWAACLDRLDALLHGSS